MDRGEEREIFGDLLCSVSIYSEFLGAFAKLGRATVSLVMSVCPSFRSSVWIVSAPTGRIFMKFDIWLFVKYFVDNSDFIKTLQD
jgi:hypothetical protein